MTFEPLNDRVLVQPNDLERQTPGGIFIPETTKERPQQGVVKAVGPGRFENGVFIETTVKPGAVVVYGKYTGGEITLGGVKYLVMHETDLLGVISNNEGQFQE
jgi:chaperonin GroES